jgi:hypothetical protein
VNWKDLDYLLPPPMYDPFAFEVSDWSLRLEAITMYRLLRRATESAPCDEPCAPSSFAGVLRAALQRCAEYRSWSGKPPLAPERRVPFDTGCGPLEDARARLGEPQFSPAWAEAATAAKLAFARAPDQLPRLRPGDPVIVQTHDQDRMIVRSGPGLSSPEVARLASGVGVRVVGGPTAADGYWWWQLDGGGWAADTNLEYSQPYHLQRQR